MHHDHNENGAGLAGGLLFLLAIASLAALPAPASADSSPDPAGSSSAVAATTPEQQDLSYTRPTQTTKLRNYAFDAFGPYPIAGAAITAGVNQLGNAPPEWNQGAKGYGRRVGSSYGIAAISVTTRYALARAFDEDTLYYRCDCTGVLLRLRHAVVSTVTARRGLDGHRVFSVSAFVAPYAGTMTAVYGWYPDRFGAKDAFRMGNYNLLLNMLGNASLEFVYGGPHSLLHRMHLNNGHGAADPGSIR
jgi:hypothetical protein